MVDCVTPQESVKSLVQSAEAISQAKRAALEAARLEEARKKEAAAARFSTFFRIEATIFCRIFVDKPNWKRGWPKKIEFSQKKLSVNL